MAEPRFRPDQREGLRPGRGRAPGLSRAVGNQVYRTNPTTGNLELVTDFTDISTAPAPKPEPKPAPAKKGLSAVVAKPQPRPARRSESGGGEPGGFDAGVVGGGGEVGLSPEGATVMGDIAELGLPMIGQALMGPIGQILGHASGRALSRSLEESAAGSQGQSSGSGITGTPTSGFSGTSAPIGTGGSLGLSAGGFDASGLGIGGGGEAASASGGTGIGGGFGSDSGGGITGVGDDGGGIGGGDGGGGAGGGGACYITEAVASQGGADDAPELETLRWFRDNVLMHTPEGQALIAEYEQAAPAIVAAIQERPDAARILQGLASGFIQPAVEAVRAGDHAEALRIYAEMSAQVAELAVEATQDPEIEQLLEEFAQEAAEVAHDGEMAGVATATGGELTHPMEERRPPGSTLGRVFVGG